MTAAVKMKRINIARPLSAPLSCLAEHLSPNSLRPKQDGKHYRPDNTPPDPGDIWVSRLPFENSLVYRHRNNPRAREFSAPWPIAPLGHAYELLADLVDVGNRDAVLPSDLGNRNALLTLSLQHSAKGK